MCWALGADGRPYVWLSAQDVQRRAFDDVWENQRWYPLLGYSSSTLPTDRSSWSNQAGNEFALIECHCVSRKSACYSLCNDKAHTMTLQNCICQEKQCCCLRKAGAGSIPGHPTSTCTMLTRALVYLIGGKRQSLSLQGWQYAFNFASPQWRRQYWSGAFVRRRRWLRQRVYTGAERWIQLKRPRGCSLVDLCLCSVPDVQGALTTVWALDRTGNIWRRVNIADSMPEGDQWEPLDQKYLRKRAFCW